MALGNLVLAKLTPEEAKTVNKWRWHDRLVSLWAPVTVLALVFVVYLTIVETAVCSYLWLRPPMQGLGLLCFVWWLVLLVMRTPLAKKWNQPRAARYVAEEHLADAQALVKKGGTKVKEKALNEVVDAAVATVRTFGKSADEIAAATRQLITATEKNLKEFRSGMLDAGGGFVRALAIALAFRAVLLDPFKIPSGSMIPTLELGDQIFVNKFIYGVRLPFTNYVPFVIVRPPRRGDVIVFNNPMNPDVDYIKRVVGVPGDELAFTDEGVEIAGRLQPRVVENERYPHWEHDEVQVTSVPTLRYWVSTWFTDDWYERKETLYREEFDGVPHLILDTPEQRRARLNEMLETRVTVPAGHVFVMGDNRNNSVDSRFGLGGPRGFAFVPYGNIKGKATAIWFSLGHGGFLSSVFGGTGVRYDRFFTPVTMCGDEAPRK
ncbi:MAG: signal peptidase I [Archangium gephyra]|uniref:Signal peptidase I n=1 Tax=Archangium gephyra TaxID=48 RepID=A0A2W5TKI6_9BACT|nr:MAG: signal peptidase I [Archangium gephyra]